MYWRAAYCVSVLENSSGNCRDQNILDTWPMILTDQINFNFMLTDKNLF